MLLVCMMFVIHLLSSLGIGNKNGSITGMFYFVVAFFASLVMLIIIESILVIRAATDAKNGNSFRYSWRKIFYSSIKNKGGSGEKRFYNTNCIRVCF